MADKQSYKNKIEGFKNRVTTEPLNATIQKVVPIKADNNKKNEIQLGVFISKDLMKKLKMKAVFEDKTIKEVVSEILEGGV